VNDLHDKLSQTVDNLRAFESRLICSDPVRHAKKISLLGEVIAEGESAIGGSLERILSAIEKMQTLMGRMQIRH